MKRYKAYPGLVPQMKPRRVAAVTRVELVEYLKSQSFNLMCMSHLMRH